MINTNNIIAGVDEAGRGPLAGPVVAAAVILPKNHSIEGLIDSKKLTAKKREKLYKEITNICDYGIGIVSHRTIDKINVLQATFKAMRVAILNLKQKPDNTLIDGYGLPDQVIRNEGVIGGDNLIECISAASIIAKVTRDELMLKIDDIFPEYGFAKHKGYGTKAHMENLNIYKACPIHRKTFSPVKKNIPKMEWLIANDKLNKLAVQLVSLHYLNKNYTIVHINFNLNEKMPIDIVLKKDEINVFVKVILLLKNTNRMNIENLTTDELKNMKYEASKFNQESDSTLESKFEIATIFLQKNPIIDIYNLHNED
jgi:ribonuclease HII|tara:strand:+ start:2649 stop:3587 length:939 start_codon:yes stop_codon:yes gene_type:complete